MERVLVFVPERAMAACKTKVKMCVVAYEYCMSTMLLFTNFIDRFKMRRKAVLSSSAIAIRIGLNGSIPMKSSERRSRLAPSKG